MDEVKEINDDVDKLERDCNMINCLAIKYSIIDFFKLIKDVMKFFIFGKKNE